MNNVPKISIITPSFQQGEFIADTIDSVLDQEYPDLEYIVIDGGSTDDTTDILRARADRLAYWVSEPDDGQSDALAKGMARASGEIIGWLNSDDMYLPGTLAAVADAFASMPEADVIHGWCEFVDRDGQTVHLQKDIDFDPRISLFYASIQQPAAFVRRSLVEKVGPPREDLHYLMDKEWWLRMAAEGAIFRRLDRPLAAFRFHGDAKTAPKKANPRLKEERQIILQRYWGQMGFGFSWPKGPVTGPVFYSLMNFYYRLWRQVEIRRLHGRTDRLSPVLRKMRNKENENPDRGRAGIG